MLKTELPLCENNEWNFYEVSLDEYAGKPVYIALRHTTDAITRLAYFDDFKFTNIDPNGSSSIEEVAIDDDTDVEVYRIDGIRVAAGKAADVVKTLDKGIYIIKPVAPGAKAIRIAL